jgi:HK97 family phage portal protein
VSLGLGTFFNNIRDLAKVKLFNSEQRSVIPYSTFAGLFNIQSDGDVSVTPETSVRISTVYTCILVRAESLSTLPASVKQYTSTGSTTAEKHPAHYLIHTRPNPFQTASDFWKSISMHMDLYGNAYAVISYSGRMLPTRIDLIPDPVEMKISVYDGKPLYSYKGKTYEDWQILHFKDLSIDGVYGISKIAYNAETIGYAYKLKSYGKNAIGSKPPGYFSTDAPFDTVRKQQDEISKGWKERIAAGQTPTLPFGLKYNNLIISPNDAQYLEAVNATKEDIYGMFRVPPTLAQNYERATFANAEQQDLVFLKYTIMPLLTNIEQECNTKLFAESNKTASEPFYVKFNANAFMRGDLKSRAEFYIRLAQYGLIDGDQVADLEDWNKWEGGNRRFVPLNTVPLDRVDEVIDSQTQPAPAPQPPTDEDQQRGFTPPFKGFIYNYKANGKPVNGHGE